MAQFSPEKWWQGGVQLAFQLSGWLVVPITTAYIIGKWLDDANGTTPWIFLGCTAVAFIITSAGIVFETASFMREISKPEPDSLDEKKLNDRKPNN